MPQKSVISVIAALGLTGVLAVPAAAHVTIAPGEATQGKFAFLEFRVPNERPNAGTVKIEVALPTEHPIKSVYTKPTVGWTADVVSEGAAVRTITWTAQPGQRINPGEFQEFELAAGPMPEGTDMLVMSTTQSYDNGEVVAWDAPPAADGAPEPEHPAPVLALLPGQDSHVAGHNHAPQVTDTATSAAAAAAAATDATARWLGGAGLVLGALGLGLAAGAVLRIRRGNSA